jgi:hypothetical protein
MRGALRGTWLAGIALLAAACGTHQAPAFHPAGGVQSQQASGPAATGRTASDGVTWPPFGKNVHIVMPSWQPSDNSQLPAVTADKNFLLAMLYAEYRGNRDNRWRAYTAPAIRSALRRQLSAPDVTTQSFTGTIRFSHLSAFPDPSLKGDIDVAQCFDNSHSTNTSLRTGQPVQDKTPVDQHYYRTTNVLGQSQDGSWQVVSIYAAVYYPRAPECKP